MKYTGQKFGCNFIQCLLIHNLFHIMRWVWILACTIIQSTANPSSLHSKDSRASKGTEVPWATAAPAGWGDAGHMQLQLKEWPQCSRLTYCQMTDAWQRNKISVWEACTSKLEFIPTTFLADRRQMTLKANQYPPSELFGLLPIYFTLFCTRSILWVREKH